MADNLINKQKRGILSAIGRVFLWQKEATPTAAPSSPPPATEPMVQPQASPVSSIIPTVDATPAPMLIQTATQQPPATATAIVPVNRLQGVTRYYRPPQKLTTRQGVGVPSPIEEDMTKIAWYSADWAKRQEIYENVDNVLANCKEAEQARDEYLDGIFNQGCTYRVIPFKAHPDAPDDPEAIRMAARANERWQDFERKRSLKLKRELMGGRIDYGFIPLELAIDQYGVITEMAALPPYGMEICLYRGRFVENQLVCYRQHDALVPDEIYGEWPELGIIWIVNQRYSWQPYGVPALMAAFGHANGLIRGTNLLPNAREAAQTQVYATFYDAAGNPVPEESLNEFEDSSRAARKERNEELKPTDLMIGNGARAINAIYGDSAFLNELGDLKMNGAVVTAIYGSNYAQLYEPHINNRSVMEKVEDRQYYFWYNQGKTFTEECDKPCFGQVIAGANWGYARQLESQGLKPQLYINPAKVVLVAEWNARRAPERLSNEFKLALEARKVGKETGKHFISARRVTLIASRVFEFDPAEEATWLAEEEAEAAGTSQPALPPAPAKKQLTTNLPPADTDNPDDNEEPIN